MTAISPAVWRRIRSAAIGGADMPVVVSMLNSYWLGGGGQTPPALGNDLLIVTGALVALRCHPELLHHVLPGHEPQLISVIAGGFWLRRSRQEIMMPCAAEPQGKWHPSVQPRPPRCCARQKAPSSKSGYGMAVPRPSTRQ